MFPRWWICLLTVCFSGCGGRSTVFVPGDESAGSSGAAGGTGGLSDGTESGGSPSIASGGSSNTGSGGSSNTESGGTSGIWIAPPVDIQLFADGVVEGMMAAPTGAVYVIGSTWNELVPGGQVGGKDAFAARFDGIGAPAWLVQFGSALEDAGSALTWTSSGVLYGAGQSKGGFARTPVGLTDVFVAAFDANGSLNPLTEFGSVGDDYVESIVEGENGQLYLVGHSGGQIGDSDYNGSVDFFVAQLSPEGGVTWLKQFGSSGQDQAKDVLVTADGSIFVVGYTDGDFGGTASAGGYDGFVMRMQPDGEVSWIIRLATNEDDFISAIESGPMGQLYVAGRTEGALGEARGGSDSFVAEIHTAGSIEWVVQVGTPAHETTLDLEVSALGDLYLGGNTLGDLATQNQGYADSFIIKMGPAGRALWTTQWGSAGYDTVQRLDTTFDSLYIAGESSGPLGATSERDNGLFIARMDL